MSQKNTLLREAINAAPVPEIYRILFEIATEPVVAKKLESQLIIQSPSIDDDEVGKENISPGGKRKRDAKDGPQTRSSKRAKAATVKPSKKVKRNSAGLGTRWAKCRRCEEKYEVLDNKDGACLYHPGEQDAPREASDLYTVAERTTLRLHRIRS